MDPIVLMLNSKQDMEEELSSDDTRLAVIYFGNTDEKEYATFWGVAQHILDAVFMFCDDPEAASKFGFTEPAIAAFN